MKTRVKKVEKNSSTGKYSLHLDQLEHESSDGWHMTKDSWVEEGFDVVIMAGPLISKETPCEKKKNAKQEQFPAPSDAPAFVPEVFPENERHKYRRCVCTLIQGELNQNYFSKEKKGSSSPKKKPLTEEEAMQKFADSWTTTTNEDRLPLLQALTCSPATSSKGKNDAAADAVPFYSLSLLIPC